MLCRMPLVHLPQELGQQLNASVTGVINGTEGPGVAVYVGDGQSALSTPLSHSYKTTIYHYMQSA